MTTRRWLIAAVVVAGLLAVWDGILAVRQRQLDYELRALDHAVAASVYGRSEEFSIVYCFSRQPPRNPTKAAYHAALARKWTAAAHRPWLPVAADPPEPAGAE